MVKLHNFGVLHSMDQVLSPSSVSDKAEEMDLCTFLAYSIDPRKSQSKINRMGERTKVSMSLVSGIDAKNASACEC